MWLRRLVATLLLAASMTARAQGPTLRELCDEAVASSPSVAALQAQASALGERARVAGAWPDPVVSVEISNMPVTSWGISEHPMSGIQLRAEQVLRPPGWSRQRKQLGAERAESNAHTAAESALQLRGIVRRSWWQLTRTRLLRDVTEQHLARTRELLSAVQIRFETGNIGQHAVLRLQLLRDRLQDDLEDFDRDQVAWAAVLQRALPHRDVAQLTTADTVEPVPVAAPGDWRTTAREGRPLLAGLQARQRAARTQAALARTQAIPDVRVWAGYRIRTVDTPADPGMDFVSVGVGVPLPTNGARVSSAERAAHLQEAAAAAADHEAALDAIDAQLTTALARWKRAYAKVGTYDQTLIPRARASLQTAQGEFGVGRADFSSLFDAEVVLLELERSRIVAAVETHLQHTEVLATIGPLTQGESP